MSNDLNLNAPSIQATQADINEWYALVAELAQIKETKAKREMELRKLIFGTFIPNPSEGVNTVQMSDGYVMKGTYKLERKPIPELMTAHAEELKLAKIPKDIIRYKPELAITVYKTLTEEQRKVFDQVIETKPSSPSLEIVKPKKV